MFVYQYAYIDGAKVPKNIKGPAIQALLFCWSDMGLQNTYISWTVEANKAPGKEVVYSSEKQTNGWVQNLNKRSGTDDTFIAIRADLPVDDVVRTVFHECRHVYQFKQFEGDPRDHGIDVESDAWRYTDQAELAFWSWPDPLSLTITDKVIR